MSPAQWQNSISFRFLQRFLWTHDNRIHKNAWACITYFLNVKKNISKRFFRVNKTTNIFNIFVNCGKLEFRVFDDIRWLRNKNKFRSVWRCRINDLFPWKITTEMAKNVNRQNNCCQKSLHAGVQFRYKKCKRKSAQKRDSLKNWIMCKEKKWCCCCSKAGHDHCRKWSEWMARKKTTIIECEISVWIILELRIILFVV